ncbi:MAG: flagellar biosynthesis protein FlhB [Gammaproteobacteria bacterium]|nr:MAG: flagellar biosynthesis protein FlhB [Gammaproteobacteria bacterium]
MSESGNEQAQEKTEQPTPKRLEDARKKGQVPRSKELNTMAVMATGAAGLMLFGGWMLSGLAQLLVTGLSFPGSSEAATSDAVELLASSVVSALWLLAPLLLMLTVSALAGPALLGGLVFSAEAARPKLERLSVLKGLKRIFSLQGLMELGKTLLKFAVLTGMAASLLWWMADDLLALGGKAPRQGMAEAAAMVQLAFLCLTGGLLLVAAVDAPFQLWNHFKQLRMTRQEVKDELKQTEGNPEMRARLRRAQQEIASGRMMEDVPKADVIIMNPTHYAVALRYSDQPDRAPRVVAKGQDQVALRIRELAQAHRVAICSAPPLTRAIYFNTDIGQEIPAGLYLAVARVLAWVMQLKTAHRTGAPPPDFPADLPVPPDLEQNRRHRS